MKTQRSSYVAHRHLTPRGALPIAMPSHQTMRARRSVAERRRAQRDRLLGTLAGIAAFIATAITIPGCAG